MGLRRSAKAMVLEHFSQPLRLVELPVPAPEPGGLLVRIAAAGICGSDLEIADSNDPRVAESLLPLVPGHEGVGWVDGLGGDRIDLLGDPVLPGDLIVWNRGLTCGVCNQCAVRRQPSLCPHREVYGISLPAREPYWLNGCYAEMIYLRPGTELLRLPAGTDPAVVVSATCSGATAAHAIELCDIAVGDSVLIIGPGPLGLYCAALALARGAGEVTVAGTPRSRPRLEMAAAMGCRTALADDLAGMGPFRVVLDAAGTHDSVARAVALADTGGVVALPGVASPIGGVCIDVYETIARRNLRLQGVWVSDARHLFEAVSLVQSGRYALDQMVSHRFSLSQANEALAAVRSREAVKAVLIP